MKQQPHDSSFETLVRSHMHAYADGAPTDVRDLTDVDLLPVTATRTPIRRIVGIGASVAALAGGLTLTGLAATGGDDGGSNTPEEAVREFVEAIENRDVLGALDVLDPGESDVLVDAVRSLVAEGSRVGALSSTVDAGDVTGAAIDVADLHFTTDQIATDVATVSIDAGVVNYSFDPATLPLADTMRDETGEALSTAGGTIDFATEPVRLATVSRDGTWYVSVGYSIAEAARTAADLPFPVATLLAPEGFDSPEAAATAFWTRLASFDFEGAISTAAPGETDALARYAPLWLADVNNGMIDATASGTSVNVTGLQFDVSGEGDRRRVTPTAYVIDGTLPPAIDDGMPVYDPTQPTMVWVANGEGFYLIDAGEPLPDDFDSLELATDFPEDLMDSEVSFNAASLLPDGSVQTFWAEAPEPGAPAGPRPFKLEFIDNCTITSGALVEDALRWAPAGTGLVDLGNGRYQACTDPSTVGSYSVFAILTVGRGGSATPEVPPIQTVEVDGQWYVSPVGTVAEQLFDLLADVPDGGILSIDSPLAVFIYGTDRAMLDAQLVGRPVDGLGTACGAIVVADGSGNVTAVNTDITRTQVQPCVESEEYWNFSSGGSVDFGVEVAGVDPVASTPQD